MNKYFKRKELLHGRDKQFPLTPEMEVNLENLVKAITPIRIAWGQPMVISSGYRPASINASVGGAKLSAHQTCQAVDIVDKDGKLAEWLLKNLDILVENELYLESPKFTNGWVHLQTRPTRNRVFIP